jgi:hypothetical protein
MTHAESQDLLLDLAYGELDAARAAEVEGHVSSCAECRTQKAALEETRRMVAPLRELEEPSPGFDDRILQAARTQAQLEHEGNVGQVIEVTGTVRPLGVEAARIDAHGPVKARPVARQRPPWVKRAAVGGSVAAAAALALVVGNTLETRRNAERVAAASKDDYQIRVEPAAPGTVETALRRAERAKEAAQKQASPPAVASAPPADVSADAQRLSEPPPPTAGQVPASSGSLRVGGSGGDAPPALGKQKATAKQPVAPPAKERAREKKNEREQDLPLAMDDARLGAPAGRADSAMSASESASKGGAAGGTVAASPPAPAPSRRAAAPSGGAPSSAPVAMPQAAIPREARPAVTPTAVAMEAEAQQARHSANYLQAASLYRDAATLRRRENDPTAAAWNLAHAVECLAAVGRFDEARQVRDELSRLFPAESGPLSAARRALREVEPTVPASRPQ